MSIQDDFHQALLNNYQAVGLGIGYWGRRSLQMIKRYGGVETAKKQLAKNRPLVMDETMQKMIDHGLIGHLMESTVLRNEFQELFTANEIEVAKKRLATIDIPDYGYRKSIRPENVVIDDMDPSMEYKEGSTTRTTVNAHERNPRARRACIAKHGTNCAVCGMSFGEVYGEIGLGFIHVHHKIPMASRRQEYELDPIEDLVPVCPNCHAMLHTSNPPLAIRELKEHLKHKNSDH